MYYAGRKKDNLINKAISVLLAFVMVFSFILPRDAFAGRSNAGGGEIPQYSWKDFGTTVGIAAASYVGGTIVSGALNSGVSWLSNGAWNIGPGIGDSFSSLGNSSNLASGYNTYMAASNVQRAVGMAGSYYDWNPSTTYWVSSLATAVTAGALNPSLTTGESVGTTTEYGTMSSTGIQMASTSTASTGTMLGQMARGMVVSAASSGASSAVIYVMDKDRIDEGKNPTWQAQAAGFLAGWAAGTLTRKATSKTVNDETIGVVEQRDTTQEAQKYEAEASLKDQAAKTADTAEAAKLRAEAADLRAKAQAIYDKYAVDLGKTVQGREAQQKIEAEKEQSKLAAVEDLRAAEQAEKMGDMQTAQGKMTSYNERLATADAVDNKIEALRRGGLGPLVYEVTQNADGTWGTGDVIDTSLYQDKERYTLRPVGAGKFELIDTQGGARAVLNNLGKSIFVEPFTSQNLVLLASRVTAIRLTDAVMARNEDKPWLEPLVNSLAQSVSAPIYGAVVNTLGTDRYVNYLSLNKYDRMSADLRYDIAMRQAGQENRTIQTIDNPEAQEARDTYETKREKVINEANQKLAALSENDEKYEVLKQNIIKQRTDDLNMALKNFNTAVSGGSVDKGKLYNLVDPRNIAGLTDKEYVAWVDKPENRKLVADAYLQGAGRPPTTEEQEQVRTTATKYASERKFNIFGQVIGQEGQRVASGMEMDKVGLSDALGRAQTSRASLLLGSIGSGVLSGAFEGGISGGADALYSKWADRKTGKGGPNDLQKFAMAYGLNMASAALRGAVDAYFWKQNTKDWNWSRRYTLVAPERYAETQYNADGSINPKYNFISDKLSQANYDDELLKFSEFVNVSNFSKDVGLAYHWEREKWDFAANEGKGGWVADPRWEANILFSEEGPGYLKSMARSMDQAMVSSFYKAFTFGRPMIKLKGETTFGILAEQVSVSTFNDYVSQLRQLGGSGPGGITGAIKYQLNKANIDAAGENVAGTLVRIPYVATTFNMRPERFVDMQAERVLRTPETRYDFKGRAGADLNATAGAYAGAAGGHAEVGKELEISKYSGIGAANLPTGAERGGHAPATEVISKLDLQGKASFEEGSIKVDLSVGAGWEGKRVDYMQEYYYPGSMPAGAMDFTVQSLSFGGPGYTKTTFWAPFPNPIYGTRPQTGEGEYLRRKGLAK